MMHLIRMVYYLFLYPVLAGCLVELLFQQPLKLRIRFWWEGVLWEFASLRLILCFGSLVHWELTGIYTVYRIVSLLVTLLAILKAVKAEVGKRRPERADKRTVLTILLTLLFLGLVGVQISKNGAIQESYSSDHMAIDINTILTDGNLRATNPMTGLSYYEGQDIVRYPVYTVFYALLASIFPGTVLTLVYKVIPVWLLLLFYSMQYSIGLELLGGERWKGLLYGIAICSLNMFGAAKQWMWGAFLMLYPWTDDSMRVCIVIPAVIWLLVKAAAAVMRGAEHERAD